MKSTDLDDLLTQQGQAWRDEQPSDPPFEAPAAMDAGASRNWIAPLIAAAAVVIGAVGTTVVVRSEHSQRADNPAAVSSTTVGWAARPPGPSRFPSFYSGLSASATAANLGSCHGDFDTRFAPDDQGGTVVLSYRGSADCALPEVTPTAQLLDSHGAVLATGGESLAIGRQGSQLIAASEVVLVPVRVCEPSAVTLRLSFNDGETMNTPLPAGLPCTGGGTAGVGVTHQRSAAGGRLGSLVQTMSAPSSVAAGQTLKFQVTLTNSTDFAVPLSPCPTYAVALEDVLVHHDPHAASSSGQLNCAASPASVAAHASITYDMQLDVSGVPIGPRRLVWTWLGDWPSEGFAGYPTVTVQ
jgi:hypothetical protein